MHEPVAARLPHITHHLGFCDCGHVSGNHWVLDFDVARQVGFQDWRSPAGYIAVLRNQ